MMKRLFLLATILLVSGCICCGGMNPTDLLSGKKSADTGGAVDNGGAGDTGTAGGDQVTETTEPGSNGGQETTETAQPQETGGSEVTSSTEASSATETTLESGGQENPTTTVASGGQAATTTIPTTALNTAVYNCVKDTGYDPDKVIYAYSQLHGDCGGKYVNDGTLSMVSGTTGVGIAPVNIGGQVDEKVITMLECFYGKGSDQVSDCPVVLCPKTGNYQLLSGMGASPVRSQLSGFAKKCK